MPWNTYGDAGATYGDLATGFGGGPGQASQAYGDRVYGEGLYGGPLSSWEPLQGPLGPIGDADFGMKRAIIDRVSYYAFRAYPGFTDAYVARDRNGICHLQSVFQYTPGGATPNGTNLGALPAGFRPQYSPQGSYPRVMLPFQGASCHGRLDIDPNGTLTVSSPPGSDYTIVDGFWFSEVPHTFVLRGCNVTSVAMIAPPKVLDYQWDTTTTAGPANGYIRINATGANASFASILWVSALDMYGVDRKRDLLALTNGTGVNVGPPGATGFFYGITGVPTDNGNYVTIPLNPLSGGGLGGYANGTRFNLILEPNQTVPISPVTNLYTISVNPGVVTTEGNRGGFTREAATSTLNRAMWIGPGMNNSGQYFVCLPVVDDQGCWWPEFNHAAESKANVILYRSLDTQAGSGGTTPTTTYPPGWTDIAFPNNLDGAGPFDVTWTASAGNTRFAPNLSLWAVLECGMQSTSGYLPVGTALAYVEGEIELGRVTADGTGYTLYCQGWRDLSANTTIGFRFYNPTSGNITINGEAYQYPSNTIRVYDAGAVPDTSANDGRNWAGVICPETGTYLIECWIQGANSQNAGGFAYILVNGVTQVQSPGISTGTLTKISWQGTLNEGDWIALGGSSIRSPSSGYWGQFDGVAPMMKVTRLDTVTGHRDVTVRATTLQAQGDPNLGNYNLILLDRRTGVISTYYNGFTSEAAAITDYYSKCHLMTGAGYFYKALLGTFQSGGVTSVNDRRWLPYAEGSA